MESNHAAVDPLPASRLFRLWCWMWYGHANDGRGGRHCVRCGKFLFSWRDVADVN